ncbi:VQ [Macleaya cordata]|uniref:VQ n=1 Tax=Macleaya cordata TaxID=56857 RepID=A0A200PMC3_MACCD|nr:VQ [Macleaya cordata]
MDPSDLPSGKPSPRRELQGPRPTPLKIRKDSHKIKKPPIAPQLPHQQQQQQKSSQPPAHQHRPPVIIYTVSPKVIHTDANDFMKLVQRLTGPSSSSLSSPSYSSSSSLLAPSSSSVDFSSGAISPAARFASIERTNINNNSSQGGVKLSRRDDSITSMEGLEMGPTVERTGSTFPSILSPMPSSLPPISPNFFSPTIDPNSLSFLHDLSPIFNGNKNYLEGNFIMPSPSTFFSAPITSPTPSFDLFNQFLDL